jgi:GT2 family glycosyltransferase
MAFIGKHYLWGANMIIRRPVLQKFKFRVNFLEDYDLGKRLRHCGFGKVRFDPQLKMMTSTRRFEGNFHSKAIKYIVNDWLLINFKMQTEEGYFKSKS